MSECPECACARCSQFGERSAELPVTGCSGERSAVVPVTGCRGAGSLVWERGARVCVRGMVQTQERGAAGMAEEAADMAPC